MLMVVSAEDGDNGMFDMTPEANTENYTIVDGMIDYSVYDSDVIYVQEHADWVEAYNEYLMNNQVMAIDSSNPPTIGQFEPWNWDTDGMYAMTVGPATMLTPQYYFQPINIRLYVDAAVEGVTAAPSLLMMTLDDNGKLEYKLTKVLEEVKDEESGEISYVLDDKTIPASNGSRYIFSLASQNAWELATLRINFTSIDDVLSLEEAMTTAE